MDVTDASDGAGYVDAATIALRFASVELGPSQETGVATVPGEDTVTPRQLRDVMGCLVTGVCVVTAVADGVLPVGRASATIVDCPGSRSTRTRTWSPCRSQRATGRLSPLQASSWTGTAS